MTAFLVLVLACWRVTHMVVDGELGPWDVLETLRFYARQVGLGTLIACPWCVSIWVAAVLELTLDLPLIDRFIYTLAISGGCMLVWRLSGWLGRTSSSS